MAESLPEFRAVYERDATDDVWLVHIEGVDGCHTYGRTKSEAAERIDEALAAWLDCEPEAFARTDR